MTYSLSTYSVEEMSDDELRPIVEMLNRVAVEESPRSVDMTVGDFRMFSQAPGTVQERFMVRSSDGDVAGVGVTRFADDGTNPNLVNVAIRVSVDHRRQGVGSMLLGEAVRIADQEDRTTFHLFHFDTVPAGKAFLDRLNAKPALEMHVNVLKVADLDRDLLTGWVEQGPTLAPGYHVDIYEGRWPDEIHEEMARLYVILDRDMPQPEGHEHREWTAELVAEMQDQWSQGIDSLMALAIHDESGAAVGMSQLSRLHSDPTTWHVTTTMVDPAHRGRSLGRWVKGAVNVRALEVWDGGVYQETANAQVNAPMLAINHEMGFEHEMTVTDVEVSVEDASRYLASRS